MTATGSAGLWVIATAGSLAFHALAGYTLFAVPLPEAQRDTATEIRFATPEDGTATTLTPTESEAVSPRHGLTRATVPVATMALPGAGPPALAPTVTAEEPLAPAATAALDAVEPRALEQTPPDKTAASTGGTASTVTPAMPPPSAIDRADTREAVSPAALETTLIEDLRDVAAVSASGMDPAVARKTDAPDTAEIAPALVQPPTTLTAQQLAALDAAAVAARAEAPEAIAPIERDRAPVEATAAAPLPPRVVDGDPLTPNGAPDAPLIAVRPDAGLVGVAATGPTLATGAAPVVAPSPERTAAAAATTRPNTSLALQQRRADVPVAAPTPRNAGRAGPASPSVVTASRAEVVQPAGRATSAVAVPVAPAPNRAAAAPTPADPSPPAAAGIAVPRAPVPLRPANQQTALLPIPQLDAGQDETGSDVGGLVRDFLRSREGDECLLAVPSEEDGAVVEAFAISSAAVETLAADFERQARSALATTLRPVVSGQCSALSFARALPQYPNYLLQVHVTNPAIRSGESLEGIVSGVGKDTLYLVAVDDEGNAKLVESGSDLTGDTYRFSEPVHLTTDPVESVQLLIAVASDGPLISMPDRAGQPADLFFSRLALEIISGNRSIGYGIGSFTLR